MSICSDFIIAGGPESKDQLHQDIRPYWSFRDNMAVIDGVIMNGRHIIIPEVLKPQVLDQLHINHMGIEKKQNYWHAHPYTGLTQTVTLKSY